MQNNKVLHYILIGVFCFLSSCTNKIFLFNPKTEVVEYVTKHYKPDSRDLSTPFWEFKERIWVSDSFAIEEVRYINIEEDGYGKEKQSFSILHYRFSNLKKGWIYEYKNFSDTATLIRKYSYSDTIKVVGGWGFNYPRTGLSRENLINIQDTDINNASYKRLIVNRMDKDIPYTTICYFSCNKKGTIFSLDYSLSKIIGCPLVKIHNFSPLQKGLHITSEILFIRDYFLENEQKVFNAWKKKSEF